MHLYKSFFRLLKRNPIGIIIYTSIFVMMILLLVIIARSVQTSDTEFNNSNSISYIDNDGSALSKGLIKYLSGQNKLTDYSGKSESKILDLVFFGISEYHMTIEKGFSEAVLAGDDSKIVYNTSFNMSGEVFNINSSVNNYINTYRDYKIMGLSDEEAADKACELLSDGTTIKILSDDSKPKAAGNELIVGQLNQYFCYLALGFLALGVGHTVIANNDELVGRRIDASPVTRKKISLTNTAGLITSGMVLWLIFIVFNIIFGHDTKAFTEYWWVIMINSFLSMLVACAITSVITSFRVNTNSLSMITNIVSLSMSFVCGVFVPQWLLGEGVLRIARFLPFYWAVYANNMTYAGSGVKFDMEQIMICFGMQAMFAVVLALAAAFIKNSRMNRV